MTNHAGIEIHPDMNANPSLPFAPKSTPLLSARLALWWCIVVSLLTPAAYAADTFVYTGSLNTVHQNHTATRLPDGRVLVAGGGFMNASAELYNPALGTWSATGSLSIARENHTATLL